VQVRWKCIGFNENGVGEDGLLFCLVRDVSFTLALGAGISAEIFFFIHVRLWGCGVIDKGGLYYIYLKV
jgi:hypothetical protein